MTRLIDADALIEKYTTVIRKDADEKLKTEIAVLLKDIEEQPTIDAVPVIRCANCKYWSAETEQTAVPNMHKCTWWRTIGTLPIDFCSRAQRKETS